MREQRMGSTLRKRITAVMLVLCMLVGMVPALAADTANPVTVRANAGDTTKLDVSAGGTTTTVDPLAQDVTITGSYTSLDIDVSGYTGAVVPNVVLSGATILPLTSPAGAAGSDGGFPGKPGKTGTAGAPAVAINGVVHLIVNADSTLTGGQGGQGGNGGSGGPGPEGGVSPAGGNGGDGGIGGAGISITGTAYITALGTVTGGAGGAGGAGGRPGVQGPGGGSTNGPVGDPGATGAAGQAIVGTQATPPTISVVSAADVTGASATLSAAITAGGETVTEAGFFYKAASDSAWTNAVGTGTDSVALSATGLTKDAEYTVRAYAVVNGNKLVGEPATFTPMDAFPTLDFATPGSTTPHTGTGYVWDSGSLTLTLTDLNYAATDSVGIALPDGATLVLNGTSSVTVPAGNETICALRCEGALTVSGTGSLSATAADTTALVSAGIFALSLTVESGSITGIGGAGAQVSSGVFVGESLTLKGGSITGVGGANAVQMSNGVAAQDGSIHVIGGTLTATSGTGSMSVAVVASALDLGDNVVAKCNIGANTGYTDSTNLAEKDGMGMVFEGTTQTTPAKDVKISKPDIASGTCGVGGTCSWRIDAEGTLILFPTNGISGSLEIVGTNGEHQPWKEYNARITAVKVESGVKAVDNSNYLFYGLSACTKMDLSGLDTTKTIAMGHMFSGCGKLTSITFGNSFDTAKVTTMQNMFYGCAALETLDMSKFNTAKVKGMSEMFSGCSSLTALDLSKFNTAEALDMSKMFYKCSKLTSLDVGSFITAKVTTMQNMFYGCAGLTSLDLSGFDFTKAWGMSMLSDCSIGLKTEYYKKEMSSSKLYLYDKHSKDDFTAGNTDLTGAESNIVYMPYTMTKSAMTNGSVTTRSRFQATDYQSYFAKTAGFYTSGAPTYDSTKEYAQQGETVTITLTPTSGHVVDTVTVKTADNSEVTLSGTGNTRTFTMPADDVTIAVTFALPPSLTVDVANKRIFAEGKEITITSGDYQKTVIQINGSPATLEGLSGTPAGGYDLSEFAIYGGKNNEALTGTTSITMTGGKVGWIYGGGYGANGTVSGDRTVTVGGTAVVGAPDKGVVIGRGTDEDYNAHNGVQNVTVQSGFTGKVYVVLPTDFDLIANVNFRVATGVTQTMLDNKSIVLTGPGSTVPGVEQRLGNGGYLYMEPPMLTFYGQTSGQRDYIYANGYPITIKAVGTEGKANIYFDHYRPDLPVSDGYDFTQGNPTDGYDLSECDIYGGAKGKNITGSTHITLEGGSVRAICGGSDGSIGSQDITLTGDTYVTIKGGAVEWVYGGTTSGGNLNAVTGTCHVTVEGGLVELLYGGNDTVGAVDVRLTGGTTWTVHATYSGTKVTGSSTISITGDAVVYDVYAGGGDGSTFGTPPTLTVGGNVQIGAEMENGGVLYGAGISLNPNAYYKGVASFAISAPLTGKVYGLLYSDYDASTRPTVATGATEADLEHFALTSSTVSDLGVKAAYLDGTDIKVKGGVTVTLDYQGADSGNTTLPVYHGEAYGPLPAPTKSGFGFTGWYDASTGGNLVTKDTVLADDATDHTLYAQWGLTAPTVTLTADKTTAGYTGATAITLTATAGHTASDAVFTYEWYKGGVKLDGKTAATLELQNVADSGSYTVKVRAASGGLTSGWVESSAVTATISKATPTISTLPTAGAISYGQALSDSALTGGAATVAGSFAWTDTAVKPACADSGVTEYTVTFTPTDTANYNTATCAVKLTVNKVTLTVSATANSKTYDGTAAATGTVSLTGAVNSEDPTATGSFAFESAGVGNDKTVNVTAIALDGSWGDNYALSAATTTATADINPRSLGSGTATPAEGITVDPIADQPYQGGTAVTPLPVVKAGGAALTNDTDYTLSYTANTAPGTATVTITGKTNYTGSVTATFNIVLGAAPEGSFTTPDGLDKWGKTPIVVTGNTGYEVSTAFDSGFGGSLTLSTEGTQTVTIYVKETATGAVTQAEIPYKLDTTAPTVGAVTGNPGDWVTSAEIGFAPTDATSGVASVTVTCDDGKSVTHDNDSFTADRNGTYTITVTDTAGNTATETVTVSKVDGTAPTASIAPAPDSTKWYGATTITVTATDGGSGIKEYSFDGGESWQSGSTKAFGNGEHTVTLWVRDNAGNTAKLDAVTLKVDTAIDELVAKVGALSDSSTLDDLLDALSDYTANDHIGQSVAGADAYDDLTTLLTGKYEGIVDEINGILAKTPPTRTEVGTAQALYDLLDAAHQAQVVTKDRLDALVAAKDAAEGFVADMTPTPATWEELQELVEDYGKLSDTAKGLLTPEEQAAYDALKAKHDAVKDFIDAVAAITKPYGPDTADKITAAGDKLIAAGTAGAEGFIPDEVQNAYEDAKDALDKAQAVEDKITDLPDHIPGTGDCTDMDAHKPSLEDAMLDYEKLTQEERDLIDDETAQKLGDQYDALMKYLNYVSKKDDVEVVGLAENVDTSGLGTPGDTVTIELSVEKKTPTEGSAKTALDAAKEAVLTENAKAEQTGSYDVKLLAKVNGGAAQEVQPDKDNGKSVVVRIKLADKLKLDTLKIYHIHDGNTTPNLVAYELIKDQTGTYAVFEADQFSYFVLFAEKEATPPPVNPGTSGGSSTVTKPEITKPEHGAVTVTPESAKPGDKVNISAKPDEGYVVDKIIATDKNGKEVAVKDNGDGTYTFTQPSGKVTIAVTFKPEQAAKLPFTDVSAEDWFYGSVVNAYEGGLMNGTSGTTFSPYLSTDRGMIVTILWRMEGSPAATAAADFSDVAAGRYYTNAVAWGAESGIVTGYDTGLFAPGDPVTREQLAAILWRYAKYKGSDVSVGEDTNILSYPDFAQISEYAIPAIQWAAGAGIISGKDGGALDPRGTATRAETATMLERFLKHIK